MRTLSILFFLGLSFTAGADTSTKDTTAKAKGKTGDACKVNTDCDQAGRPQRCRESKCELAPVHPVT